MDFSTTLFRASSIGHLMVEPQSKAAKERGELAETAKTHLVDVYVSAKYGRNTDIQNKYIAKGHMVEEDSITLYSRLKKKFFKKNEEHLSNVFIKGTPDLYEGKTIRQAEIIIDTKSSWDIFTFFRVKSKPVNSLYYWQGQSYMALSGAKRFNLAYCLVDTPETIIQDEERKLLWRMNAGTTENPDYIEACQELRRLMTYPDIPLEERLIEYCFERNDEDIERMYDRVKKGRAFLQTFDQEHCSQDIPALLAQREEKQPTSVIDISTISLQKIK